MARLREFLTRNREVAREAVWFVVIGVLNTVLFFVIYNLMRFAAPPFVANAVAVVIGASVSFWGNRRFTFRVRGSERVGRQLLEFAAVFGVTLVLSSGALEILYRVVESPSRMAENVALGIGSVVVVTARFLLLRYWVFKTPRQPAPVRDEEAIAA